MGSRKVEVLRQCTEVQPKRRFLPEETNITERPSYRSRVHLDPTQVAEQLSGAGQVPGGGLGLNS